MPLVTLWFDKDGVLYVKAKNVKRDLEMQKEMFDFVRKISGNKLVGAILDSTTGGPLDKPVRDYVAQEMPKVY